MAFDHGEFGGEVWWEPDGEPRERVVETNLRAFVPTTSSLLGLAGLAHLSMNEGQLLKFERVAAGQWRATSILDLGAAPTAFTVLPDDTLLVAAVGRLLLVRAPRFLEVLHESEVWHRTYPTSLIRDQKGVIYVGMRSGVARLTPKDGRYTEDWVVPANCARRRPTGGLAECECIG